MRTLVLLTCLYCTEVVATDYWFFAYELEGSSKGFKYSEVIRCELPAKGGGNYSRDKNFSEARNNSRFGPFETYESAVWALDNLLERVKFTLLEVEFIRSPSEC